MRSVGHGQQDKVSKVRSEGKVSRGVSRRSAGQGQRRGEQGCRPLAPLGLPSWLD